MISLNQGIENIVSCFFSGKETDRKYGRNWYPSANLWCKKQAEMLNVPMTTFVAVVAAISPSNRWERNKIDAINLFQFGRRVNISTYNSNKRKALNIIKTNDVNLLHGPKVMSFYNCIMRPKANLVVVDRHAYRVFVGRYVTDDKINISASEYNRIVLAYKEASRITKQYPAAIQASTWMIYRNSINNAKRAA